MVKKDIERLLSLRNKQLRACYSEKKHLLKKYENAKKIIKEKNIMIMSLERKIKKLQEKD